MSRMSWLAAVLSPSDVAPHPNFFSGEKITEESVVALLCVGRWQDLERALEALPGRDPQFLDSIRDSFIFDQSGDAALWLANYLEAAPYDLELAKRTAVALLTAVSFSELDRYREALAVLDSAIVHARADDTADGRLLLAALIQQRALRTWDLGDNEAASATAQEVSSLLSNFVIDDVSAFDLSLGVGWDSTQTVEDMRYALASAARGIIGRTELHGGDTWQAIVRSRPGYRRFRSAQNAADSYDRFVIEQIESRFPDGSTTYGATSADNSLWVALTGEELLGDPSARSTRAELGRMRFLQGVESGEDWLMIEAIGLLRQGRDQKRLRVVTRQAANSGPLASLRVALERFLFVRPIHQFSVCEFIVLRAGASLLDVDQARDAYLMVRDYLGTLEHFPIAQLQRVEECFGALSELANMAGSNMKFAASMLHVASRLNDDQQLFFNAIARALQTFDWSLASENERLSWTEWLRLRPNSDVDALALAQTVSIQIDAPMPVRPDDGRALDLTTVAQYLDQWVINRRPVPTEVLERGSQIVIDHLRDVREQAHKGVFTGYSVDGAFAAVVIARLTKSDDVWHAVSSFVSDPSVQQEDTQDALSAIAREPETVPPYVGAELRKSLDALLYATRSVFGNDTVSPYPSALGAMVALGQLSVAETVTHVATLTGANVERSRSAACSVLYAYVKRVDSSSIWATVLALQLAQDSSALVRAGAGRVLALVLLSDSPLRQIVLTRLLSLLSEDGLSIPMALLGELARLEAPLPRDLQGRIGQLAVAARSSYVRRAAEQVASS